MESNRDQKLKRYIELNLEIKKLQTELDSIRADLKVIGTHDTENYVCLVEDITRTLGPDAETLKGLIGESRYIELSSAITYKTVKVSPKVGGA